MFSFFLLPGELPWRGSQGRSGGDRFLQSRSVENVASASVGGPFSRNVNQSGSWSPSDATRAPVETVSRPRRSPSARKGVFLPLLFIFPLSLVSSTLLFHVPRLGLVHPDVDGGGQPGRAPGAPPSDSRPRTESLTGPASVSNVPRLQILTLWRQSPASVTFPEQIHLRAHVSALPRMPCESVSCLWPSISQSLGNNCFFFFFFGVSCIFLLRVRLNREVTRRSGYFH